MNAPHFTCSICQTEFELHFRYQLEERTTLGADGQEQTHSNYYCSQRCLEDSHRQRSDGTVACDACATRFKVELASQVLFTGGRRHYACNSLCRSRIVAGARAVRVGQLQNPDYQPNEDNHVVPTAQSELSPTPPPASVVTRVAEPAGNAGASRPRVIAVFNHKGGTGKTTTSVHLAAGLALAGHRVLLVDTDGQGNIAASLGLKAERTLYHVIVMGLDYREAVISARPNLDALLSNESLAAAELYIAGQRQRDRILAARLAQAREHYDYVVVDCSPSLSLMNQNALVLADAVLCPVACDFLSLYGVRQVLRTIKQVNRLLSHPVKLWGVLPTMYDSRARICKESIDTLKEHFKESCLEPVHYAIRAKEAPAQGKTLFEYAPTSPAANDYRSLVGRLLGEANQAESAHLAPGERPQTRQFLQAAGGET
jgi:chromosome partitioning protein